MSKLVEKLHKISEGESHRMGFSGSHATAPKVPALALIVGLPRPDAPLVEMATQSGADALMIQITGLDAGINDLQKAVGLAGDIPCGVMMESALPEDCDRLAAAGVDFLVMNTEVAPSALLRKENIGRVVTIDPYLEVTLLRSLERLAIDVLIVNLEQDYEAFLTVREVMALRRVVEMVRKPVILQTSNKLSTDDLANVRDLGAEGILVQLSPESHDKELPRLRQIIDELPPRRKPREGADALLPKQRAPKQSELEDDEI